MNEINVDEYFVEVVDEGGGTIDYAFNPNSSKYFLVNEIYEQNRQLQQLKKENEELKAINKANADNFIKYQEIWKQENYDLINKNSQLKQKLKKIKDICNESCYLYDKCYLHITCRNCGKLNGDQVIEQTLKIIESK